MINDMSNGKAMIIHLIIRLMKKIWYNIIVQKLNQYIPKPYEPYGGDTNVKVDLSKYATKADIKNFEFFIKNKFS